MGRFQAETHLAYDSEHYYVPNVNLDDAMDKLKRREKDVGRYHEIMLMTDSPEKREFQRKYDAFYRVRRNEMWRSEYFRLMRYYMNRTEPSFGEILLRLHQSTGQIEASFASKMLATINANMPIWDKNVLSALNHCLTGKTPELKMSNAVVLYDKICRWYQSFLQTDQAEKMLRRFDLEFPSYRDITTTKKIDFVLWASEQNNKKAASVNSIEEGGEQNGFV